MCLYPKLILNKKYLPTKKNNFNPPKCEDERTKYVPIGCGVCIECRTQKAREWQVRLNEELKTQKHAYFITLTFSEESLNELQNAIKNTNENLIATIAIRRFLERYRKKYKHSLKHWFITELGHNNTERIHLHGIIFPDHETTEDEITNLWKYGYIYKGEYCNEKTINYIIKYVTKIDNDHKEFNSIILSSAGLGSGFLNDYNKKIYKYIKGESKEYYKLPNGQKVNLPIYYRNHFFNEEERMKLWQDRLEKGVIYVRGIEIKNINTEKGQKEYFDILHTQQEENLNLGYKDGRFNFNKKAYRTNLKILNSKKMQKN